MLKIIHKNIPRITNNTDTTEYTITSLDTNSEMEICQNIFLFIMEFRFKIECKCERICNAISKIEVVCSTFFLKITKSINYKKKNLIHLQTKYQFNNINKIQIFKSAYLTKVI